VSKPASANVAVVATIIEVGPETVMTASAACTTFTVFVAVIPDSEYETVAGPTACGATKRSADWLRATGFPKASAPESRYAVVDPAATVAGPSMAIVASALWSISIWTDPTMPCSAY
jgi:hypothetical protein